MGHCLKSVLGLERNNHRAMTGVDIYQLCVPSAHAGALIDDWAMRRVPVTLRLRLARTPGHVVIETTDVMFAASVRRWEQSECQVNIIHP
jgi:hypothetical protein